MTHKLSIRSLLGLVAFCAVAVAALGKPSYFCASVIWTMATLSLVVGVVGTVCTNGQSRAFWIGYSVFGWFHMILAMAPWFDDLSGEMIITRQLLDKLGAWLGYEVADHATMPGIWHNLRYASNGKSYQYLTYLAAGQSLFTVVVGMLGGCIARYMYGRASDSREAA